ncbi:MAG: cytochrome b, partial [Betaproteobacteria bacterium]|nr:cytochrome b [Betaproteobacteria bacterium]
MLHWVIAALVASQFVVAWFMPHIGRNAKAEGLISLHFSLGVLILLLMTARWIYRLRYPVALEMPDSPIWERWAAHWMHITIYFILLVSPWLG